jgi:hypothetical protein
VPLAIALVGFCFAATGLAYTLTHRHHRALPVLLHPLPHAVLPLLRHLLPHRGPLLAGARRRRRLTPSTTPSGSSAAW